MPSNTNQRTARGSRRKRAVIFTRARLLPPGPAGELGQLADQEAHCRQIARRLGARVVAVYRAQSSTTDTNVYQTIFLIAKTQERRRP